MKKLPLILLSLFLLSFNEFSIAGSEKTEDRKLSGFSSVKVSSGIDLFLSMGDAESVKVVADEDIIDNVKTEVENGTLKIYMKFKGFNLNWNRTHKVYVALKSLENLDASSGTDVIAENVMKGNRIKISASSGSDVKLKLEYDDIQIDSSSGSDAELTGTCNTLKASSSSGSNITAPDLKSKKCHVSASSGADAVVYVSEELEADASSGGDVRYLGIPRSKNINESSGGDVTGK
jgi:hypothetical protein